MKFELSGLQILIIQEAGIANPSNGRQP